MKLWWLLAANKLANCIVRNCDLPQCNWTSFYWKWWDKRTSKIRHTRTMNELQMSSYVLAVETRDHITANNHPTMVRQEMMQTMWRDTHLVNKVVGRFGDQIISSYDTIYNVCNYTMHNESFVNYCLFNISYRLYGTDCNQGWGPHDP